MCLCTSRSNVCKGSRAVAALWLGEMELTGPVQLERHAMDHSRPGPPQRYADLSARIWERSLLSPPPFFFPKTLPNSTHSLKRRESTYYMVHSDKVDLPWGENKRFDRDHESKWPNEFVEQTNNGKKEKSRSQNYIIKGDDSVDGLLYLYQDRSISAGRDVSISPLVICF